jgi:kumamolisin
MKTMARTRRASPSATRAQDRSASRGVPLPPAHPLTLTVYLRHRQRVRRPGSAADLAELGVRVTRKELEAERKRILKRPVEQVRRFAEGNGMKVVGVSFLSRIVTLRARVSDAEGAFSTKLVRVDDDGTRRHCPTCRPKLPITLAKIAHAVVGMDTRVPKFGRLRSRVEAGNGQGLYPSQIAKLYGIATAGRGAGQHIAIIEPAGGYDPHDIEAACDAMKVTMPAISAVNVGRGRNALGVNPKADQEVALDLQVLVGIAPEARITVYFTELSEPGLVAGLCKAVHGSRPLPSVIIVTWGEPEEFWPKDAREGFDAVLQDAVRLGITVVTAAGDDLATEAVNDGKVHVDYPASSPYVLACGGTAVTLDANQASVAAEVVWNDHGRHGTGGGISGIYAVPDFQGGVTLPASLNDGRRGRGVPDVAAAAAEINGYRIKLGGTDVVASGTSAVAPLWGAFIALLNEQRGATLGFVNSRLYQSKDLLKAIESGDNIDAAFGLGYTAGAGWSACAGLGVPKGAALVAALTALS